MSRHNSLCYLLLIYIHIKRSLHTSDIKQLKIIIKIRLIIERNFKEKMSIKFLKQFFLFVDLLGERPILFLLFLYFSLESFFIIRYIETLEQNYDTKRPFAS